MAQMADPSRPAYPPPQDYQGYSQQHPSPSVAQREERSSYPPPPDANRQGQYPPAPQPYQPPAQWAGPPQGQQPYAQPQGQPYAQPHPPPHHYDPQQHAQYHYPPPAPQPNQTPMHPDPYRLPPVYHYAPTYVVQPAPAPRQRTAIACKYCRKRKIRCSGYDSSPDGRCQNCVRFNQQCLFHPVSSQAAFVPASAVYGPNARAPMADGSQGQNGQSPPMLYGAHGQPLGPAGPGGQPQYSYPLPPNGHPPPAQQQVYPPPQYHGYPAPWPNYGNGPPPDHIAHGTAQPPHVPPPPLHHFEPAHQPPPPPTATSDRSDRGSLKRGPPDDEPHNEIGNAQSPRPTTKPRHSAYDGRPNGSFEYQSPTSPAGSTMSYQSYPTNNYSNSSNYSNGVPPAAKNNSPPAGLTPNSNHSIDSRTPPPAQPGSAGSSQNGRSGMKVHEMLGGHNHIHHNREQRGKNDNEMLSKLDGKR